VGAERCTARYRNQRGGCSRVPIPRKPSIKGATRNSACVGNSLCTLTPRLTLQTVQPVPPLERRHVAKVPLRAELDRSEGIRGRPFNGARGGMVEREALDRKFLALAAMVARDCRSSIFAVAVLVMIPLLRSKSRNTPLLIVLAALWLTNFVFHVALIQHDAPMARHSLIVGIDMVIFLVTVIGGRIVPAFTAAAVRQQGVEGTLKSRTALTVMSVVAMAGVVTSDIFWPDSRIAGWVAAVAAAVQLLRLLQWRTLHTLRQPIVWILHLAYAWLPLGLALKAGALLGGVGIAAFWLHALTIGALTTMITAVMTRAALGQRGRMQRVSVCKDTGPSRGVFPGAPRSNLVRIELLAHCGGAAQRPGRCAN
jgi:NnrS protein